MSTTLPTPPIARAIDEATRSLLLLDVNSDEYAVALDRISKLDKIRSNQASRRLSPDTVVLAATNLVGIMLIIGHEHTHVITSKALASVMKTK